MQDSLLTPQDKEFLAQLGEASRLGSDFMLHDLLRKGASGSVSCAGVVPIWFEGSYLPASEVFRKIQNETPYSMIYEQWNYRVYQDVEHACAQLSKFDARVLWVAAGFDGENEHELYQASSEAVTEAKHALYGDDAEQY